MQQHERSPRASPVEHLELHIFLHPNESHGVWRSISDCIPWIAAPAIEQQSLRRSVLCPRTVKPVSIAADGTAVRRTPFADRELERGVAHRDWTGVLCN